MPIRFERKATKRTKATGIFVSFVCFCGFAGVHVHWRAPISFRVFRVFSSCIPSAVTRLPLGSRLLPDLYGGIEIGFDRSYYGSLVVVAQRLRRGRFGR